MSKVKLNSAENYESIGTIKITKDRFPIAYENKVEELVSEGVAREEAEEIVDGMEVELELYYDKGTGFFAVESEAVECSTDIFSPYTGELCEKPEDDE